MSLCLDHHIKYAADSYHEWINTIAARHLPPDIYLRAFGNDNCKRDVAEWCERNGYRLELHPDGRTQFMHNDELLGVFRLEFYSERNKDTSGDWMLVL